MQRWIPTARKITTGAWAHSPQSYWRWVPPGSFCSSLHPAQGVVKCTHDRLNPSVSSATQIWSLGNDHYMCFLSVFMYVIESQNPGQSNKHDGNVRFPKEETNKGETKISSFIQSQELPQAAMCILASWAGCAVARVSGDKNEWEQRCRPYWGHQSCVPGRREPLIRFSGES